MRLNLIDTHTHLYEIENLKEVLNRAKDVGIIAIICVSSNLKSSRDVLKICKEDFEIKIFPAIGLHPQNLNISELEANLKLIKENIAKIVSVGEIGLDFWYKETRKEGEKRDLQRKIFEEQLDLAKEFNLPVIIHSRGAWRECFYAVFNKRLKKAVFHWYSGPLEILKEIIYSGYFISATPSCGYSREHREAVINTPLENLLLETDSPINYKDFISEPRDILRVLREVSVLKEVSEDKLAKVTTENAIRFFNLKI